MAKRTSKRPPAGKKMSAKQKARKRRNRTILFIVEIVVLIIMLGVLYTVLKTTQSTRFNIADDDITVNEQVAESETMQEYRNIALFGVDSRDKSLGKGNRTDTIMIASINQETGDIKLVSVYRDTYLNLGNDSYNKCNGAYAKGGPQQAINMLNMNMDLNIKEYVTVGFTGVEKAIDALGGVEIDVTEAEIEHLNNYQISMVGTTEDGKHFEADEGKDYTAVKNAGLQTLNGLQATAYCRIRYIGDDFKRAERQRTVLLAMSEKAKNMGIGDLNQILDGVFPNIETNLDIKEVASLLKDITKYNVVENDGFPFADLRKTGNIGSKGSSVVPISLEDNVTRLHEFLFEDEAYTPSAEVKKYSQKVISDTQQYVGSK